MKWTELLNAERPSAAKFPENRELALSAFERDYYTIVCSSYFRRLQKKTQVYTLDESDFIRNRLTHSLEVSSIGEMLGKRVGKRIQEMGGQDLPENFVESLSMVLRCAGLLHDIGNPPFGHSGEEYIRDFFEKNEAELREDLPDSMWLDFINFEGNAQNLRIITKSGRSSNPEDTNYGMDLTNAVINSIIKYPYGSLAYLARPVNAAGKKKRGKIGYYHAEQWILDRRGVGVARKTGTLSEQNGKKKMLKDPIMLLMEASDDIAYATADVEDAIKKDEIPASAFAACLPKEDQQEFDDSEVGIQRILKKIREQSMVDVLNTFLANYPAIMEGTYEEELIDGCQYDLKSLKRLLNHVFAERDDSTEYKYNSRNQIQGVLRLLTEIVRKNSGQLTFTEYLIREELAQYLKKGSAEVGIMHWLDEEDRKQETLYHKYLAIVDFVSGMTESYVKIFLDNWHDPHYINRKKEKYKKKCIESMTQVESFSDARKALQRISHVDQWENLELSMLLGCYLKNSQIQGLCEHEERYQTGYRKLSDQYDPKGITILQKEDWKALQKMLSL